MNAAKFIALLFLLTSCGKPKIQVVHDAAPTEDLNTEPAAIPTPITVEKIVTNTVSVPTPVGDNEWFDEITQLTWLVGGRGQYNKLNIVCSNKGWRPSMAQEIQAAGYHGMFNDYPDLGEIWAADATSQIYRSSTDIITISSEVSSLKTILCIKVE